MLELISKSREFVEEVQLKNLVLILGYDPVKRSKPKRNPVPKNYSI